MGARYHSPTSLADCLALLSAHGETASVVAGGTIATPRWRAPSPRPEHIIDIAQIPELRGIAKSGLDRLIFGAATTCTELAQSGLVRSATPLLSQAALTVGGPQIRNVATVGGNIAIRCPRADLIPSLLVLDATVTLQSQRTGMQRVPLRAYLAAPAQPDELLTAVECEAAPVGTAFLRQAARRSLSPAIVSVAARLKALNGTWRIVRIALGGAGPMPMRVEAAERALGLSDKEFDDRVGDAAEAARQAANPQSDVFASASYRREIVGVLTRRALIAARTQVMVA